MGWYDLGEEPGPEVEFGSAVVLGCQECRTEKAIRVKVGEDLYKGILALGWREVEQTSAGPLWECPECIEVKARAKTGERVIVYSGRFDFQGGASRPVVFKDEGLGEKRLTMRNDLVGLSTGEPEWGTGSAACFQLAVGILADFLRDDDRVRGAYAEFARRVLGKFETSKPWLLTGEQIKAVVEEIETEKNGGSHGELPT